MNDHTPEHTAVRVALWRALHVQVDTPPHILTDEIGLRLVGEDHWRDRPDMNPEFSKQMRASIVGRARFVEDLVKEKANQGVRQYVILGAGLDTFAQRHPEMGSSFHIFEVDQPGPQTWKQKRLKEIGLNIPQWLHFVPVDFEGGQAWWKQLIAAGFDQNQPAIVVSTGVSMYLTHEAIQAMLQQVATLAQNSTFAMTFMLSPNLLPPDERATLEFVMKKTRDAGTPFISLFAPSDLIALAKKAGLLDPHYVSANHLYQRYFANRSDGLNAGNAEAFLVANIRHEFY